MEHVHVKFVSDEEENRSQNYRVWYEYMRVAQQNPNYILKIEIPWTYNVDIAYDFNEVRNFSMEMKSENIKVEENRNITHYVISPGTM